jgi:hypothetical protein
LNDEIDQNTNFPNCFFYNCKFYYSRIRVFLNCLAFFVLVSLVRGKTEKIERKFKTEKYSLVIQRESLYLLWGKVFCYYSATAAALVLLLLLSQSGQICDSQGIPVITIEKNLAVFCYCSATAAALVLLLLLLLSQSGQICDSQGIPVITMEKTFAVFRYCCCCCC